MNKQFLRLLGALFAVALIASACGSQDDSATSTNAAIAETEPSEAESSVDDATEIDNEAPSHEDGVQETAASETDSHEDEDADSHSHEADGPGTIEVDAALPIPEVSIELVETDVPGTFDLAVSLVNFTITPDAVDGEPVPNEGHMHLLIDGQKVERFTELERQVLLPDGENLVEVELNANNHAAYTLDGEPIRAGLTVVATSLDDQVPEDAVVDAPDAIEAADVDVRITASVLDGVVTLEGDDRVEASVGDTVLIEVSGDSEELIHLHGFNIFQDLTPDTPAVIEFVPEAPGRFEIEVERTGAFIAELVVS